MNLNVVWSPAAVEDVERLHQCLHQHNPDAAQKAARVIVQGAKILISHPDIGRPMADETGFRELFLAFGVGAYVLRYRRHNDILFVVRVWHSREDRN